MHSYSTHKMENNDRNEKEYEFNDLNKQYSPSQWSKRFDAVDVIENHVKFAVHESLKSKETVPCILDVPYGTERSQRYDVFGTDLAEDAPIFIFVHGGYWQELDKDVSAYMIMPFYKKKYKVAIVNYTLCPDVSLTDIINEIKCAFLKIVRYASMHNSKGIHIAGHSAGAHLTACLIENCLPTLQHKELSVIKSFVLISGIYDLVPLINTYVNEPLKLTKYSAITCSPLYFNYTNTKYNIKFIIAVGENESNEFKKQSAQFYNKLRYFQEDVRCLEIKNVDHFDIVEKLNDDEYELLQTIQEI